jgi:hypothetical protein
MYGYEESKKVIMVQEKIKGHTFFYYKEKGEYTYFVLKNSSLSSPEKCFCYYIEYFSGKPETMKKRGNQRFDFVF